MQAGREDRREAEDGGVGESRAGGQEAAEGSLCEGATATVTWNNAAGGEALASSMAVSSGASWA